MEIQVNRDRLKTDKLSRNRRSIVSNQSHPRSCNIEPIFSIDYSPRSKFLQKMRAKGRLVKSAVRSPSKPCIKRKTKDVGTDPPSVRLPRYKDVGTDPPDFYAEQITVPKKHARIAQKSQAAGDAENIIRFKHKERPHHATSKENLTYGPDVRRGLASNQCNENIGHSKHKERPHHTTSKEYGPDVRRGLASNQYNENIGHSKHKERPHHTTTKENLTYGPDIRRGLISNECYGQYTFDCPSSAIQELKQFRESHWFDCHGDASKITAVQPNHSCVHKYALNDRKLPEPLSKDYKGRSVCSKCGLTAASARKCKHEIIIPSTENTKKRVTFQIPDPLKSQPTLRSTVESKSKVDIPTVPTLSYVPHFPQRVGRSLKSHSSPTKVKDPRKVIRHTINCKTCLVTGS
ncbi:hypothetical protein B566_EDAN007327 [Ephemera danica]|nr:hypothetical protein B566_EDAN007327 [Ephemera danica]